MRRTNIDLEFFQIKNKNDNFRRVINNWGNRFWSFPRHSGWIAVPPRVQPNTLGDRSGSAGQGTCVVSIIAKSFRSLHHNYSFLWTQPDIDDLQPDISQTKRSFLHIRSHPPFDYCHRTTDDIGVKILKLFFCCLGILFVPIGDDQIM